MTKRLSPSKATDYLAIAFSQSEIKRINRAAQLRGMSPEDYIRSQVLRQRTPQLPRI